MNASIRKFLKEEDGVTALEYGLLAAIVAGVLTLTARPAITSFFSELFKTLEAVVKTTV